MNGINIRSNIVNGKIDGCGSSSSGSSNIITNLKFFDDLHQCIGLTI